MWVVTVITVMAHITLTYDHLPVRGSLSIDVVIQQEYRQSNPSPYSILQFNSNQVRFVSSFRKMRNLQDRIAEFSSVNLSYSVHSCSSVTGKYYPSNVLINAPHDQASRWAGIYHPASASSQSILGPTEDRVGLASVPRSSEHEGGNWICLELDRVCLFRTITFGKFIKVHPCTVKAFAVYAGLTLQTMKLVHNGSLKSDTESETFGVGWREAGRDRLPVPVKFIKVIPLTAQVPNYNCSIWFLAFGGVSDHRIMHDIKETYLQAQQIRTILLTLKHLRDTQLFTSFSTLLSALPSSVSYEHKLLTKLHSTLVVDGDLSGAEKVIGELSAEGLFDLYCQKETGKALWTQLEIPKDQPTPGRRGGHGMVVDSDPRGQAVHPQSPSSASSSSSSSSSSTSTTRVYLFGGWDGTQNYADLWVYSPSSRNWREILPPSNIKHSPSLQRRLPLSPDPSTLSKTPSSSIISSSIEPSDANLNPASPSITSVSKPSSMFYSKSGKPPPNRTWPKARSCHKLALDEETGWMYLLGRYEGHDDHSSMPNKQTRVSKMHVDGDVEDDREDSMDVDGEASKEAAGQNERIGNDFWRFNVWNEEGGWECLSLDTANEGGPSLIYDHQMIVDSEKSALYIYGGACHASDTTDIHSGMFKYDIKSRVWTKLFGDSEQGLESRTGHSMIWNPTDRSLLIFGGLRIDNYLADSWKYYPDTSTFECLTADYSAVSGPQPAFTPRANLDVGRDEIVVLSGLTRQSGPSKDSVVKSELWTCELKTGRWKKIEGNDRVGWGDGADEAPIGGYDDSGSSQTKRNQTPSPRYAHQFVYDARNETFYLYGGNSGTNPDTRLDDFWQLEIVRCGRAQVEQKALLAIRKQRFIEMCDSRPAMEALLFLQNQIHAVVSHDDHNESKMFQSLMSYLLSRPHALSSDPWTEDRVSQPPPDLISKVSDIELYRARTNVFQRVLTLIGDADLKEPTVDLVDLVEAGSPALVL